MPNLSVWGCPMSEGHFPFRLWGVKHQRSATTRGFPCSSVLMVARSILQRIPPSLNTFHPETSCPAIPTVLKTIQHQGMARLLDWKLNRPSLPKSSLSIRNLLASLILSCAGINLAYLDILSFLFLSLQVLPYIYFNMCISATGVLCQTFCACSFVVGWHSMIRITIL